jgi:3-hydroxy-9,10-secoandrosta-1,3,5(10)-triene-9,17-dione monooxygenase
MTLLDVATALAPELAAARAEGDELRRLPDSVWKSLLSSGILRSLQPARWGGGEVHIVEFLDAVMELSRANPSAGWVAGVIGVHPFQLALFDERAQDDLWSDDPATMHSSSYVPTGKAEPVDGGYTLSGRWAFSSGCDHCRGVNLGATLPGEGGAPDFRSFLLLPDQYRIEDTWFTAGLRGTGSKDIVVDETFVPAHRTQSHMDYALNRPLPGRVRNDGVLFRLPQAVVFNLALAASILGVARGYIEAWTDEAKRRWSNDVLTHRRLADAVWDLDASVAMTRAVANRMWSMAEAGEEATMDQRGRMRWDMNRGLERVADACVALHRAASGRVAFVDHPLHAPFQDLQAAMGHTFVVADPVARSVGGHLLGTDTPEFVL